MAGESKFGKLFLEDLKTSRDLCGSGLDSRALRDWIDDAREHGADPAASQRSFLELVTEGAERAAQQQQQQQQQGGGAGGGLRSFGRGGSYYPIGDSNRSVSLGTASAGDSPALQPRPSPAASELTPQGRSRGSSLLPLTAVAALLQHGALERNRGATELVVHSPRPTPRGPAAAPDPAEPLAASGRRVWFGEKPVVSIHLFDTVDPAQPPRMEVIYKVPWWAWGALVCLSAAQIPVLPLLLYTSHQVDRGIHGQALLLSSLTDLLAAAVLGPLWHIAGGWGGELSGLRSARCLAFLALSGVAHLAYHLGAVRSAYDSKEGCGNESCPPLSLLNLAPLVLCGHQWLLGRPLHPSELLGAALISAGAAASSLTWYESLEGRLGTRSWLCAIGSSVALAIKLVAARQVAELPPAASLLLERICAGCAALVFAVAAGEFGLWDPDLGPPNGAVSAKLIGAAALSWLTSCLVFFTLRHLGILTVAACITAASSAGVVLLAPYVHWWDPWRAHPPVTAGVSVCGALGGVGLVAWAQRRAHRHVVVPVDTYPRKVPRRPSGAEKRRRWRAGDTVGVLFDARRGEVRAGLNGRWALAFTEVGCSACYPAFTAGPGWRLRILRGDDSASLGPPGCSWLSRDKQADWDPSSAPLQQLGGPPGAVTLWGGSSEVRFDQRRASVGCPDFAVRRPHWGMLEAEILATGEGPLIAGWVTAAHRPADWPGVGRDDGFSWGVDGVTADQCSRWHYGEVDTGAWPAEWSADWEGPRSRRSSLGSSAWDTANGGWDVVAEQGGTEAAGAPAGGSPPAAPDAADGSEQTGLAPASAGCAASLSECLLSHSEAGSARAPSCTVQLQN